jgi:sRNA-binding regulator protein Hfq
MSNKILTLLNEVASFEILAQNTSLVMVYKHSINFIIKTFISNGMMRLGLRRTFF